MPKIYAIEKLRAIKLRQEGKSYREIQHATGVRSRGTLSLWFQGIELTPAIQKIIDERRLRTEKNVLIWSKARSERIRHENKETLSRNSDSIGKLSDRDLALIGAALYWGEGSLRANKHGYHQVKFSNSSTDVIRVFMYFSRKILKIDEASFRPEIHIYPNLKAEDAIAFWSKITFLPKEYFHAYNLVSGASKGKRPFNFLPYGTLQIRINGRQNFYRIRGYIDGIIKGIN